jgi:hypothetical protein
MQRCRQTTPGVQHSPHVDLVDGGDVEHAIAEALQCPQLGESEFVRELQRARSGGD